MTPDSTQSSNVVSVKGMCSVPYQRESQYLFRGFSGDYSIGGNDTLNSQLPYISQGNGDLLRAKISSPQAGHQTAEGFMDLTTFISLYPTCCAVEVSRQRDILSFVRYVTLSMPDINRSVFIVALIYLSRYRKATLERNTDALNRCGHCLLLAAMLLSSKYLNDFSYVNKDWSDVAGLGLGQINLLEADMLKTIGYSLFVSSEEHHAWNLRQKALELNNVLKSDEKLAVGMGSPKLPTLTNRMTPVQQYRYVSPNIKGASPVGVNPGHSYPARRWSSPYAHPMIGANNNRQLLEYNTSSPSISSHYYTMAQASHCSVPHTQSSFPAVNPQRIKVEANQFTPIGSGLNTSALPVKMSQMNLNRRQSFSSRRGQKPVALTKEQMRYQVAAASVRIKHPLCVPMTNTRLHFVERSCSEEAIIDLPQKPYTPPVSGEYVDVSYHIRGGGVPVCQNL